MPLNGRRTGALSSFGFGGTNAHAVLGESEVPVDFITLQRPPQSLGVFWGCLMGFLAIFSVVLIQFMTDLRVFFEIFSVDLLNLGLI